MIELLWDAIARKDFIDLAHSEPEFIKQYWAVKEQKKNANI